MLTTAFICRSLFDRIFFSWVYDDLVKPLRTIVDSKLQKNNAKQPSPSSDSSKFNPSLNPLFSLGDPSEEKKRKCKKQFEYIQQETTDRYDHIDNTRDDEFINNNFKEMSLTKAAIILHKLFGWEVLWLSFLWLCSMACDTLSVVVMKHLMQIFERMDDHHDTNNESSSQTSLIYWSFFYMSLNFIVKIASSASFHYLDFMRFKDRKHNVECMREEFLKAISKISFIQKQKTNFGKVSTILDSDISTVANAKYDLQDFHAHIAYVILNFVTMANIIGVKASCSGVAFLALSTPIYHHFMKKREAKQKEEIGLTENKSSFITQFLLSIKLIKVYTLEIFFNNKIKDIQDSIGKIRTIEIGYNFLINSIHYTQTALFSSITFFVFCYMDGNSLKLSSALCVIELVDSLKWPLYNLSSDIQALFSKRLSIVRIGQILNSPKYSFHTNYLDENSNTIIEMKNVHATWSFSQRGESVLKNVTLEFERGKHYALIGKIGSGKTTLIQTILNECHLVEGTIKTTPNLSISYVSQNPWVRSATIRDNILFGSTVEDEKRLEMVLCASDLKNDVAQMKNGVLQVIGQRGINLSGGQKTRLALARALYHNSDLYLFDDIFSALDIHTTYRILNALFTGEEPMLKNKTVILSSHQLQFLQHMDSVIVMDKGQIVEQDHFDHLCKKLNNLLPNQSTPFSDLISSTATINDVYDNGFVKNNPNEPNTTTSQNKENNEVMNTIANTAKKQPKPVNSKLMLVIEFLFSLGSLKSGSFIFAILCLGALEYTMVVSSDVFLSEWTSDENFHNHSLAFYTSIYNIHGILIMIAKCVNKILIGNFLYILAGICQETLLKKLAEAKLSLYEDMPSGHILQYFRYIDEIRNDISWKFYDLISTAWDGLIGIVMVLYAFPQSAFLLVILIPITNYYRNIHTSVSEYIRDLQQETHDPTMTIANEILDGLDTIRAFGHDKFDFLIEEIREKKKPKTSLEYCLELLWMWFFWRNTFFREFAKSLCLLGAFFVFNHAAANHPSLERVAQPTSNMATHVSLHIAISLFYRRLSSLIISSSRLITTYTKATNSLACVEKVQHFTNTIEEENYSYPNLPFKEFQTEGSIVFHNVSMRYRKENALALDSISFGIKPGQKCAIIGKTASGKSSIFNCLLRFQEIEKDLQNSSGIYLDGIDIREIPLTTLRKYLSYIPQQPTLFLGTLRENLDFNSSLSDSEIIQVLDKVGLTEVLHHKILNESSKFDNILDYKILDNANNFSQGEKQLICLARCILKKSKIILMDEATSNIDNYTDVQIQKTLRGPLFENCTIITIAHRIATVKDYDKMILLSNGQVLMDDIPEVVLRQFETCHGEK